MGFFCHACTTSNFWKCFELWLVNMFAIYHVVLLNNPFKFLESGCFERSKNTFSSSKLFCFQMYYIIIFMLFWNIRKSMKAFNSCDSETWTPSLSLSYSDHKSDCCIVCVKRLQKCTVFLKSHRPSQIQKLQQKLLLTSGEYCQ